MDVDKKYNDFRYMDDPNYVKHMSNLRTIVPKSYIHVTKESLTDTLADCQLTIAGVKPSQNVDLCTSFHEKLNFIRTVESDTATSRGPVSVDHGMYVISI